MIIFFGFEMDLPCGCTCRKSFGSSYTWANVADARDCAIRWRSYWINQQEHTCHRVCELNPNGDHGGYDVHSP
jgi:hypothetical protein